jgi:hypothetical protein
MKRILPLAALAVTAAPAWAADCPSELKPTDDYNTLSKKIKCLNDRINDLEKRYGGGAAAPSAKGKAPASHSSVEASRSDTEWNDFRIAGRSCRNAGKSLLCRVTFTAPKNVSLAIFMDNTALFDQDGGRTPASGASFGRKLGLFGYRGREYVRLDLSKGVASTAEFEFKKGADAIQAVSAISLSIHDLSVTAQGYEEWDIDRVVLKNLPVVR